LLIEANRLVAEGNYDQAMGIYERLADAAVERRIPRAPHFYIHAGRAGYLAKKNSAGAALFRRGLSLFAEQGRWAELQRSGERILNFLSKMGYADDAMELQSWIEISFPKLDYAPANPRPSLLQNSQPETHFLTQCPYCGAPVDPREVERIDADTIECLYCGNIIRGEVS
jgi:hypothetical protein